MSVEVEVQWRRVTDDPAFIGLLDEAERERAERKRSPQRYIAAHALLRTSIGDRLGVPAASIAFDRTCATCGSHSHGKPSIVGHPELFISLSYAGGLAVVALTSAGQVGADVEEVTESDFDGFNVVTLADQEVAAMESLATEQLRAGRATIWARKEAILKATGHGLVVDPREVVVSGPLEPAALVDWLGEKDPPGPVQVADVDLGDLDHQAAVAVVTDQPLSVVCHEA